MTPRTLLAAAAVMLLPLAPAGAETPTTAEITEWEVPWPDTRPRDPYRAPDGAVWFVGQAGHYVGVLDPESGEFRRIDLEDGAGPHTVIVNESGAWYAGNRADHIGHIATQDAAITRFEMPGDGTRDPHTMAFTGDGNIWFTAQHGNKVGFLDITSSEMTLYDIPTPRSRPYGLVMDADDRPWFTLFGTNALGTITTDGAVQEIRLPRDNARPRRLAITDDGMVWYVDFAQGWLGRYNPDDGGVEEWRTPGGAASGPYAMGADAHGQPWFVETGVSPNRFVGFDPVGERFFEPVAIPSGGGTVRHMMYDAESEVFWFGTDTNTVGRAALQ